MTVSLGESGDGWTTTADGESVWGKFGAAGLLAVTAQGQVLLQKRVHWSHHGGTWGIPGGAIHSGEVPRQGALREAQEEAGVTAGSVRNWFESVAERGGWRYTTVAVKVVRPFTPLAQDGESAELRWVDIPTVAKYPLHPAFAKAWPELQIILWQTPFLVVVTNPNSDAVSVEKLKTVIRQRVNEGFSGELLGLPVARYYPPVALFVGKRLTLFGEPTSPSGILSPRQISAEYCRNSAHRQTEEGPKLFIRHSSDVWEALPMSALSSYTPFLPQNGSQ